MTPKKRTSEWNLFQEVNKLPEKVHSRVVIMKKKTAMLIAIAIVAALYAVPWFIAYRTANYSLMFDSPRPTTPAEFAAQYPVLNAVLWVIRVDMFAPMRGDVTALHYAVEINTHCFRNVALSVAILATCAVLLLVRPFRNRWCRALARTAQVLIGAVAVLSLAQATYSWARHERVVPKWDRKLDTNVLSNHYRFENMNQDVEVPDSTQGVILTKSEFADLHIGVDRRGWLSIGGSQVTRDQLEKIINSRASQVPLPRFLLWVDFRCRADVRNAILSLATNIAPEQTYFVVREENHQDMNTVHKGLHHNKYLDHIPEVQ